MSIIVNVAINGISVPLELNDDALEAIAAALPEHDRADAWPEWMAVPMASKYLDMPEERVRKLAARGVLPVHQEAPGCRIFFHRRDLDEAMFRLRQGGGAA